MTITHFRLRLYAALILPAALTLLLLAGRARAADTSTRMENPDSTKSSIFTNCTSKGQFTQTGTKVNIKLSKTSASNTDGVHCARVGPGKHCIYDILHPHPCASNADCGGAQCSPFGRCADGASCTGDATCLAEPGACRSDFDDIICLVPITPAGSFVVAGDHTMLLSAESIAGTIVSKHDVCKLSEIYPQDNKGTYCPLSPKYQPFRPILSHNVEAICYENDPVWWVTHPIGSLLGPLLAPHDCEMLLDGRPGDGFFVEPTTPIIARSGVAFCSK